MGVVHGREGKVKLGNNAIGDITSWSINESAAFADSTSIGDEWTKVNAGFPEKSWSGQITCLFNDTDANGQEALRAGDTVALINLYVAGDASGEKYYNGAAVVTEVSHSASRASNTEKTFSFQGNGALSKSTVA